MHFITDMKNNEPDILSAVASHPLRIYDESQLIAEHAPPPNGWTHEELSGIGLKYLGSTDPLDAFLGDTWVGSTEI